MFLAMNHFKVGVGRGADFESHWKNRKSYLEEVPGFVAFHLVRGDDEEDGTHAYASHTTWESRAAFVAWTESEAFRKAHGQGRMPEGVLLGPPRLGLWQSV